MSTIPIGHLRYIQIWDDVEELLAGSRRAFLFEVRNIFTSNAHAWLSLSAPRRRLPDGKWRLEFTTTLSPNGTRHTLAFGRDRDRLWSSDLPAPLLAEILTQDARHPGL